MKQKTKDLIKISLFMNTFEWYDFAIFGFMTFYIGKLFFNAHDPRVALLTGFLGFTSTYLFRPFGAIILGYIGAKHSPAHSLQWSMYLMAIPIVIVGFLPTYQTIGIYAPIILILLRLIQGIGSGGESASGYAYVNDKNKSFLLTSLLLSGSIFAIFLSSIIILLLNLLFVNMTILAWAWRIPFLLGFPLAILVFYMRKRIFLYQNKIILNANIFSAQFFKKLILGILTFIYFPTLFIITFFWYPNYLIHIIHVHNKFLSSIGLLTICISTIFFAITFKKAKYNLLLLSTIISCITIPLIIILSKYIHWELYYIFIFIYFGVIQSLIVPNAILYVSNLYSQREKVLGIGLSLAIGNAFLPLISTTIANISINGIYYLGMILFIVGIISVIPYRIFYINKALML